MKAKEPTAKVLLRAMIRALDRDDSETYWSCLEQLNAIHIKAIKEAESEGYSQSTANGENKK